MMHQEKRLHDNRKSRRSAMFALVPATPLFCSISFVCGTLLAGDTGTRRVYSNLVDPREHPDYERRAVRPPDWDTFKKLTHLITFRGFEVKDNRIVDYKSALDRHTKTYELGDVLWPFYPMLFADNLEEVVDEIKRRDLYLFEIWGYVPGISVGGMRHFKSLPKALKMLEDKLGPRWLGMDVGEQDGRYIKYYADQMCPTSGSRLEQYYNFLRFFQRMTDDHGNKMAALVSLNFGHYFLKEGVYTLLGAETAQALPNSQVYYSFIRGACKQYGVLWYGNASIYNRWGWKVYGGQGADHGPTQGTSLSLLKRLIYTHILYNSVTVGFENAWFEGNKLSPIGEIQQAAGRWIKANGQPGTMLTPVAIMTDFFAGWSFPRHLYSSNVYRVWGNLPYGPGDYLTDSVIDMLYPEYQNSSYYHDESGFLTPTPYGDIADCLLSDTPNWLLSRYPLLVVAGKLTGGAEIRDKLQAYVEGGGHLVITAGNVAKMPGGLAGVRVVGPAAKFSAKQQIDLEPLPISEESAFELLPLPLPDDCKVLARCGPTPAAVDYAFGKGMMLVLASPFGVGIDPAISGKIPNEVDQPLPNPFPLLKYVTTLLDREFCRQVLFEAGPDSHIVTCRKSPGVYTLGVSNNTLRSLPFEITSHCGPIESIRELAVDISERGVIGHLPPGIDVESIGANDATTIAGGDIRIFEVRLKQELVEEIPHVSPPPRPRGRILPLRKACSIKDEIHARPTFFEHYDGVMVDWRYLASRDVNVLAEEAGWIGRQGLRVIVDLTSGINHYPELSLVNIVTEDHAASMKKIDDVLAKMKALGARDLVLSMHYWNPYPTTDIPESTRRWLEGITNEITSAICKICRRAEEQQTTVHLRIYPGKSPVSLADGLKILNRIDAPNLRLAPSTAYLAASDTKFSMLAAEVRDKIGLWMVGSPAFDIAGQLWSVHEPIAGNKDRQKLKQILSVAPNATIVFDVLYDKHDAEYIDASLLARQ